MSEKITLPGLVSKLSARTGDTKKETEDFVRELFNIVGECLQRGEAVRIRDLGVFKTIDVEARKSVDVNTGTEVVIGAHRKISFTATKELAAKVNEPFEMFQTIELPEDVSLDNTDAEEEPVATESGDVADERPEVDNVMEAETSVEIDVDDEADNDVDADRDPEPEGGEEIIYTAAGVAEYAETPDTGDESDTLYEMSSSEIADEVEITMTESPLIDEKIDGTPADDGSRSVENVEKESLPKTDDSTAEEIRMMQDELEILHDERKHYRRKVLTNYWVGVGTGLLIALVLVLVGWSLYDDNSRVVKRNVTAAPNKAAVAVPPQNKEVPATDSVKPAAVVEPEAEPQKTAEIKDEETKTSKAMSDAVATQPSDKKVYDTISTTRYLTTMAKDHYGNYHLWPYIYMENQKFLGHPDRIRPGTKVVIPSLSKYNVDPKNPNDIAKAKKLGTEIYSRYK